MAELTSHHKERYGRYKTKADPNRCAKGVWSSHCAGNTNQCARKRGHGPEGAFCKQHDPEAAKARAQGAAEERERLAMLADSAEWTELEVRQSSDNHFVTTLPEWLRSQKGEG